MQVFAHRGASGEFPENTLLAIEAAIQQGADGIELDVQQALDDLAVTHDRYYKSGDDYHSVASTPMQALQQHALPENQFIPTLTQVMQCISGRCAVNIELKTLIQFDAFKHLLTSAINEYQFAPEQIIVSAFNHHILKVIQEWDLGVEIAALTSSLYLDLASFAVNMGANAVHADVNALTPSLVEDAHQFGLAVRVYTVDLPQDIEMLQKWGVDAIFSNFPKRAKQLIAENQYKLNR
ncbi:glycerophosphodiester phosphodiesterase [Alteromonas sp. a30]|uniref:glycerophosphodiester phosphodiesterase n=1 Tax=Alteromonas sp. a30 TaxID=2730917 RepID=UPI00228056DA|nr:glycerophosphodiester phosphodiesterase [Alteromonas sp. a30]MCY7295368.1 glycerophosphodiester phosphodiesterase [Alteromonas sp. a30]